VIPAAEHGTTLHVYVAGVDDGLGDAPAERAPDAPSRSAAAVWCGPGLVACLPEGLRRISTPAVAKAARTTAATAPRTVVRDRRQFPARSR
jgi:hypothetical protein